MRVTTSQYKIRGKKSHLISQNIFLQNNNNNNFNSNIIVRFFRKYLQTIYNL